MDYAVVEKNDIKYLEANVGSITIRNEQDILNFIAHCGMYDTNRIMLHEDNFPEEFFDLKTTIAGSIMQKISQYYIKAAIVIHENRIKGRFGEMVLESKKMSDVRYFTNKDDAENWLTKK